MVTTSRCTAKMALTKLLTYHAFRVQSRKKIVSTGMIGTFRYLGLDPSICLAKNFRISMNIYENCILNDDILRGMWHAARQLVTAGVRMLPCFPGVGDGADYGTFGPRGPSASVAQRTGEVHGFFQAKGNGKGYRFAGSST